MKRKYHKLTPCVVSRAGRGAAHHRLLVPHVRGMRRLLRYGQGGLGWASRLSPLPKKEMNKYRLRRPCSTQEGGGSQPALRPGRANSRDESNVGAPPDQESLSRRVADENTKIDATNGRWLTGYSHRARRPPMFRFPSRVDGKIRQTCIAFSEVPACACRTAPTELGSQ